MQQIVLACCALHNILRARKSVNYTPPGSLDEECLESGEVQDGEWRRNNAILTPLAPKGGNCYSADAKNIREKFSTYFNGIGSVEWQDKFIA